MSRSPRVRIAAFCLLALLFSLSPPGKSHAGHVADGSYLISEVSLRQGDKDVTVEVRGNSNPTYTVYELVDPLRLVLDIADAAIGPDVHLPITQIRGPVAIVSGRVIAEQTPPLARFEILLNEDTGYAVNRRDNDIVLTVNNTAGSGQSVQKTPPAAAPEIPGKTAAAMAPTASASSTLSSLEISRSEAGTTVRLPIAGPLPAYRYAGLPAGDGLPARLYIDLPGTNAKDLAAVTPVGTDLSRVRLSRRENGLRLVFDANGETMFPYTLTSDAGAILVTIGPTGRQEAEDPIAGILASGAAAEKTAPPSAVAKASLSPQPSAAARPPAPVAAVQQPNDKGVFTGYSGQLISVDFYKIDLHNVFRLIGEVSGKNIVVDEGVSGSLTLTLDNVPWDFALDVVLNLKSLRKEERFDTIVISPKDKEFSWPEIPMDSSIDVKVDPITVTSRIETPKGQIAARQIISQAKQKEAAGDPAGARDLYEKAFAKWPENGELASLIAASLLVHEQQNARAVHYAKEALRINPADHNAALLAAIGMANMKKDAEAKEHFDLAVSGDRPASAALQSYAAFLEEGGDYPEALAMLARHENLHGDSLETLIARARLHDKNGDRALAAKEYRSALLSGYPLPQDLEQYIRARLDFAGRQ